MSEGTVYWTWPLDPANQLRISVQSWRGRPALDIRRYWLRPDGEKLVPTKFGVKIYADQLPSFLAALVEAAREVDRGEVAVKGLGEHADNRGRR